MTVGSVWSRIPSMSLFTKTLVVVLRPGAGEDPDLTAAIASTVAGQLGKPLKPERVAVVAALPRTRSGKVMRRAIRAAWLGLDPGDLSSLDDPGSLESIRAVAAGAPVAGR